MIRAIADMTWKRAGRSQSRPPGRPSRFGTSGTFVVDLGPRIEPRDPRGYYIDFRSKAESPTWPPAWYEPHGPRLHVVIIQWGLGCHERFLAGEGEEWLAGARACADELVSLQQRGGGHDGGWVQRLPYKHTYRISPPWLSAMVQGEGASLLVRLHRVTGDERYAEAAVRALAPMRKSVRAGGVAAELGGARLLQEYPTEPPSHVFNGAMFALWGPYDVAAGLGDPAAQALSREAIEALASALPRFDTGYWSRYDLFPHPVLNLASPFYHRLHTDQLRAMALIDDDPSFVATASRFEAYARSRINLARAYARKVLFRAAVPRNPVLAYRMPWARGRG